VPLRLPKRFLPYPLRSPERFLRFRQRRPKRFLHCPNGFLHHPRLGAPFEWTGGPWIWNPGKWIAHIPQTSAKFWLQLAGWEREPSKDREIGVRAALPPRVMRSIH
jgi:hypothetical protein